MKDIFKLKDEFKGSKIQVNGITIDCDSPNVLDFFDIAPYLFETINRPYIKKLKDETPISEA